MLYCMKLKVNKTVNYDLRKINIGIITVILNKLWFLCNVF